MNLLKLLSLLTGIISLGLVSFISAAAPVCSQVFSSAVASHDDIGQLTMTNSISRILNDPNYNQLPFNSIKLPPNESEYRNTCGQGKVCGVSGKPNPEIDLPSFQSQSGGKDLTINNWNGSSKILSDESYRDVIIDGTTAEIQSANKIYKMRSLLIRNSNSKLILPPGDYYIETLTLDGGAIEFDNSKGEGNVRLHVKNYILVRNSNSGININGSPNNVVIYVHAIKASEGYGVKLLAGAQVSAFLYVGNNSNGNVKIENSISKFTGRMTVRNLEIIDATVEYAGDPNQVDFGDACDGEAVSIDHFEIIHSGTAISCKGADVTVKACLDADCNQLFSEPVNATLNKSIAGNSSVVDANSFTGSKSVNFSQAGELTASLSLSALSPNAPVLCKLESGSISNCDINFSDSGLFVSSSSGQSCAATRLSVQALKSDQSLNCTPVWRGRKNVNLRFNYANPASNPHNTQLSINNLVLNAGVEKTKSLTFDNSSTAKLSINYADAGQLSITASDPDNILQPGSGQLTMVPAKLVLSSGNTNAQQAATDFSYKLSAQCDNGNVTPNYQADNLQLKFSRNVPNGATYQGVEANLNYANNAQTSSAQTSAAVFSTANNLIFNNGEFVFNQAQINEAGQYQLAFQDTNYLNSGLTISSNPIELGLFIPAKLSIYQASDVLPNGFTDTRVQGAFNETIGTFSYLGQNFGYAVNQTPTVMVLAENAKGETLYNYSPALNSANLAFAPANMSATSASGKLLTASFNNGLLSDNNDGSYSYQFSSDDSFSYTKTAANAEQVPFESDISLRFNSDFFVDQDYNQISNSQAKDIQPVAATIYAGRLTTSNNFGPETDTLNLPVYIEYYTAAGWMVANNDTQTQIDSSAFTFGGSGHNLGDNWQNSYSLNTNKTVNLLSPDTSSNQVSSTSGQFYFNFDAPGANNTGALSTQINLSTLPYLQYDWNKDNSLDTQISSELIWGLYRGSDKVIYWRERYD